MLNSIKGISALVTGGGSGLGLAVIQRLAQQGARVVAMDLKPSEENISNVVHLKGDIRKESDIQEALSKCVDANGSPKLDAVVNCAGVANAFKLFNFSTNKPQRLQDFNDLMNINIIGTFNVIRLAAELLGKNPVNEAGTRGCIINTSSILAWEGHEGQAGYAASQMAINAMTLPLSRDFANQGIRVNTIAPGFFDTPLVGGQRAPELYDFITCATPLPSRMGQPVEFAALVQSILENNMINGEVIRIDGACRWPERG